MTGRSLILSGLANRKREAMPGFIIIEKQNLPATLATIRMLPHVGAVEGYENYNQDGIPSPDGKYDLIRIEGDSRFVEFAIRNQGYAKIIKAMHC